MTADTRLGTRRASLRSALREGDALQASRAGSRLRIHGASLTLDELTAARAARARLGHAIREARWRKRLAGPSSVAHVGRTQPLPKRWRVHWISNVVAGLAMVALLAIVLIPRPVPQDPAPAAAPELVPVQIVEARIGGRGRTTVAVALAAPDPTPAPTAKPSPTAAPTAVPTVAPVARSQPRSAAPAATPGGVPGGSPGGVPGGQPGGTGVATPIPTPNRAPLFATPKPAGFDRVTFHVTNGINGEPLQDVCIVIGTGDCQPSRPHTNALGLWWFDLPRDAAVRWDPIHFILDRFTTSRTSVTYLPGRDLTVEVKLYQIR